MTKFSTLATLVGPGLADDDSFVMVDKSAAVAKTVRRDQLQIGINNAKRAIADADATLVATDTVLTYTSISIQRTVTVDPTALTVNKIYAVQDESGGVAAAGLYHKIVITPSSGTIDGIATAIIQSNYGRIEFYSNGTHLFSVANKAPLPYDITIGGQTTSLVSVGTDIPAATFTTNFPNASANQLIAVLGGMSGAALAIYDLNTSPTNLVSAIGPNQGATDLSTNALVNCQAWADTNFNPFILQTGEVYDINGTTIVARLRQGDGLVHAAAGAVCCSLFNHVADVNNTTTAETTLCTDTLAAGLLVLNGSAVEAVYAGVYAATSNAKRVRLYFGTAGDNTDILIFDSGSVAVSAGGTWRLAVNIVRVDATHARIVVEGNFTGTGVTVTAQTVYTAVAPTLANAQKITLTGTSSATGASNDITLKLAKALFCP